jgi:hypothetical protein
LASEIIHLVSPHTPAECARRLRLLTDPRRPRGRNPLIGTVGETALRLRRRVDYRSSFQIHLFARLLPQASGTLLECRFRLNPLAVAFLVTWFTFVIIGLMVGFAVAFDLFDVAPEPARPLWPAAIIPVLMAAFAFIWLRMAQRMALDDEEFMLEFLRFSIDAQPAPRGA